MPTGLLSECQHPQPDEINNVDTLLPSPSSPSIMVTVVLWCNGLLVGSLKQRSVQKKIQNRLPVACGSAAQLCLNPLFSFSFPLSFIRSGTVSVTVNHGEAVIGTAVNRLLWRISVCFLPSLSPSPSLGAPQQLPKTLSELWPQRCGTRAAKIESVFVCKCARRRVNSLKVRGKTQTELLLYTYNKAKSIYCKDNPW